MFLAAVSISTVLSGLHMNLQSDCEHVSINRALKAVIPNNDCFFCFVSLVISCNKMLHNKRDLKLLRFFFMFVIPLDVITCAFHYNCLVCALQNLIFETSLSNSETLVRPAL